jgi:hypothetical protein
MLGMNYRLWSAVAAFTILVYSSTVSAQTITSWKVGGWALKVKVVSDF